MIRIWIIISVALVMLLTLLISGATLVGSLRGGVLLAVNVYHDIYNAGFSDLYLLDFSSRIPVQVARVDGYLSSIQPNQEGQLALVSCNRECDVMLWDGNEILQLATFRISASVRYKVGWVTARRLILWVCSDIACSIQEWNGLTMVNVASVSTYAGLQTPTWSATGLVAFNRCNPNSCEVMLWDGETLRNLTDSPAVYETGLEMSSSGWLAYRSCAYDDCSLVVWDGNSMQVVFDTFSPNSATFAWSDDNRLAFSGCVPINCDIMLWDGETVTNITENTPYTQELTPLWSDDGRLTFSSCDTQTCDLMLWDGELQNLTNTPNVDEAYLAWSHTGQMTFSACNTLFVCSLMLWDGEQVTNLTQNELAGAWNATSQLLFTSCQAATRNCELLLWQDGGISQITHTPTLDEHGAAWLP